jgi:hypothetical protein
MIKLVRNVHYVLLISFKFASYCLLFNCPKERERGGERGQCLINGNPRF